MKLTDYTAVWAVVDTNDSTIFNNYHVSKDILFSQ